jgi:hypothetical protein
MAAITPLINIAGSLLLDLLQINETRIFIKKRDYIPFGNYDAKEKLTEK